MRAIISFHAIDDGAGPLSFPARQLDSLLGAFHDNGIPVVPLDILLASNAPGVSLTFDDGMASVHDAALPVLEAHGAPAHLFLTTSRVSGDNRWAGQPETAASYAMLNWAQIERLVQGGVLIDGHTANHPDLRTLDEDAIDAELDACDSEIERRFGRRPRFFAYPYGFFDDRVRAAVSRHYAACVTTELRYLSAADKPDALPRLDSHYLRSPFIQRHLSGPAVRAYLGLRCAVRLALGRS
jgi:peptidoglycan/xylan/chitin deacetylase (PgdA/CDA1 family)